MKKEKQFGASDLELVAKFVSILIVIWTATKIFGCMSDIIQSRDRKKEVSTDPNSE